MTAAPLRPVPLHAERSVKTKSQQLREAVDDLAKGGKIIRHQETAWASITFAGTRHRFSLTFDDLDAADKFLAAANEHEFSLPGQLVADCSVTNVDRWMTGRVAADLEILALDDGRR